MIIQNQTPLSLIEHDACLTSLKERYRDSFESKDFLRVCINIPESMRTNLMRTYLLTLLKKVLREDALPDEAMVLQTENKIIVIFELVPNLTVDTVTLENELQTYIAACMISQHSKQEMKLVAGKVAEVSIRLGKKSKSGIIN